MSHSESERRPVTAVLVGAGIRSMTYAQYALQHPDELKITSIVEPNVVRRNNSAQIHQVPPENCFATLDELVGRSPIAETAINGTLDRQHVPLSLQLLEAGYHVMLEKPVGLSMEEVQQLLEAARKYKRNVIVCHVLRYAPFYAEIRRRIKDGVIGEIRDIKTVEHLSYHHMAHAYVRGKWSKFEKIGSSMLMSKCCHDLDIVTWMKSGIRPRKVSSFGGLSHFKEENAPAGSGTRCLVDCKIERDCPYSALKNYVEQENFNYPRTWEGIEHLGPKLTKEQKIESLRTDNPYGRCVWRCDNDVVDHQNLLVEFEDNSTAVHSMIGGAASARRSIHVVGTLGEIEGILGSGYFVIRFPDARPGHSYSEERVEIHGSDQFGHGGGDLLLVKDFVQVIRGMPHSISTTTLEDSIYGHMIGFAADQAMAENREVTIDEL